MSKIPTVESLISKRKRYEVVKGKTLFYVEDIKKTYPKATIHDTDIVTHKVVENDEEKEVELIDLSEVKF